MYSQVMIRATLKQVHRCGDARIRDSATGQMDLTLKRSKCATVHRRVDYLRTHVENNAGLNQQARYTNKISNLPSFLGWFMAPCGLV